MFLPIFLQVLFELARFHAPSTIFMDELESIMGQRGAAGGTPGWDISYKSIGTLHVLL